MHAQSLKGHVSIFPLLGDATTVPLVEHWNLQVVRLSYNWMKEYLHSNESSVILLLSYCSPNSGNLNVGNVCLRVVAHRSKAASARESTIALDGVRVVLMSVKDRRSSDHTAAENVMLEFEGWKIGGGRTGRES